MLNSLFQGCVSIHNNYIKSSSRILLCLRTPVVKTVRTLPMSPPSQNKQTKKKHKTRHRRRSLVLCASNTYETERDYTHRAHTTNCFFLLIYIIYYVLTKYDSNSSLINADHCNIHFISTRIFAVNKYPTTNGHFTNGFYLRLQLQLLVLFRRPLLIQLMALHLR